VVVSAGDNIAVTGITLRSGASNLGTLVKGSDGLWRATFNAAAYPNGTYLVSARATDAAGNIGSSPTLSLTVRH
jgi:Bacterial Ig-like domain